MKTCSKYVKNETFSERLKYCGNMKTIVVSAETSGTEKNT